MSIDHIIAAAIVFGILKFLPIIFSIDFLDPIQNTFEELKASDIVFAQAKDYDQYGADSNIVLINTGPAWLGRKPVADMLNIVNLYEPKVVAFDVFFRTDKDPGEDIPLRAAISSTENIVMASQLRNFNDSANRWEKLWSSHSKFTEVADYKGYANLILDKDKFRTPKQFAVRQKLYDSTVYALSVVIANVYAPEKAKKFLARDNEIEIINYKRNADKYVTLDWDDVLRYPDKLEFVRDRIVFFGFLGRDTSTIETEDIFFSPMNPQYTGRTFPDMYGMVVHANVISMILEEDFIDSAPEWTSFALAFFIVYFNMVLFQFIRDKFEQWYEPASIIITIFELLFFFAMMMFFFLKFNLKISIAGEFFPIILCATAFEVYHDSLKPLLKNKFKRIASRIIG